MSEFRVGKFGRTGVSGPLAKLCPQEAIAKITDIRPEALVEAGKTLVLLDVDNTLVEWRSHDISDQVKHWLKQVRALGVQLCIISNTKNVARLQSLAEVLDVPYERGRFKPSRQMFVAAMERFNRQPENTVMIGDQLFTDILGANRSGIDTIWVAPIANREFAGTKVNRFFESLVRTQLYKVMESEPDDLPIVEPTGFFRRKIVRQFAKFCIVGGSSFVIDYCVRLTLVEKTPYKGGLLSEHAGNWLIHSAPSLFGNATARDAFFPIAATCGAAIAILNSFYWNRRWTFNIKGNEEQASQLRRFIVISVAGLALNVLLSTTFLHLLPGNERTRARLATVIAAFCVAFWNFLGQRLYAFRRLKK